jgi:transposase
MEATGVYYENLAHYLNDRGFYVSVVLPNKSKKYLQSLGLKSKNDKIDAQGISRMGAEQNLESWRAPKENIRSLRDLTRQYQSFQESKTVFNNQLKAFQSSNSANDIVISSLMKMIATLDNQIKEIKKEIELAIKNDEEFKGRAEKVCTIKGVSTITVAPINTHPLYI